MKIDEIYSLARISLPCGDAESIQVTRRVVAPKSNTGRGAIAQTNALASNVCFRCSRASGARTRSYFEKSAGLINSNMSWLGPVLI